MPPPVSPALDRRRFLKATGVSLALPMLESLPATAATKANVKAKAERLVCVGSFLGLHTPALYPEETGANYEVTTLLEPLREHRAEMTVFSGLDHRASNGHNNWPNFLCGKNVGDMTLDQRVAREIGHGTRFASLEITAGQNSQPMCFTEGRVPLPMMERPSVLYRKLFATGADRERSEYLIRSGHSALDQVLSEAKSLQSTVSAQDRVKLDEYFASVRDVEKRMERQLNALKQPVPEVDIVMPDYDPVAPNLMLECESLMYDLMALALETDSSRVISLYLGGLGQVFTIDGQTLQAGYHALSHHGNDPDKIRELVLVEIEHMKCLARFITQLKQKSDAEGRPLLDSTLVLFGTGMGDASRHANSDLPTLVAGGGLKHGRHLAFDKNDPKQADIVLGDLYLTLMHQLGMESDTFSNASKNLDHLLI